jgi:imidazolonepropionase-like amidohydrolase
VATFFRRFAANGLLCLIIAGCAQSRNTSGNEQAIAITNVTIIDVSNGGRQTGMTVVTKGDQIAQIGSGISIPSGAAQVNGTGKFLMPGLWDMHAHHQATGIESEDLFIANGVVGSRDMGADLDFILPLRDRIRRGELLGPEIVAAGPMLDNAPPDWPFRRTVKTAAEAREAVRDLKQRGVDFIKVHDHTPREVFFAIADEAPKVGLSFAGHVPGEVTVEEAAGSGMKSIEHLANFRVFIECGGESYDTVRCQPLFDKLAAKGTWQTPTLAFMQALPEVFSGKPLPHAEYASATLIEFTRRNQEGSKPDARMLAAFRSLGKTSMSAVRDLHSRGNRLLAGCDGLVPGFCVHDELQTMTEAGLSPLQAIQTATINPAAFLGREKTQGTIEVGKRADMVLLEADPLIDIQNTHRIDTVVVRGRLVSKPEIDKLIAAHRR